MSHWVESGQDLILDPRGKNVAWDFFSSAGLTVNGTALVCVISFASEMLTKRRRQAWMKRWSACIECNRICVHIYYRSFLMMFNGLKCKTERSARFQREDKRCCCLYNGIQRAISALSSTNTTSTTPSIFKPCTDASHTPHGMGDQKPCGEL